MNPINESIVKLSKWFEGLLDSGWQSELAIARDIPNVLAVTKDISPVNVTDKEEVGGARIIHLMYLSEPVLLILRQTRLSPDEFDADLLIQGNIEKSNYYSSSDNTQVYITKTIDFNNLIRKIQSRAIVPYQDESQKPEVLDEWMTSQILIITATPNDDTDKQVKQKNLHRLLRHLRIGLFLVLPVIAIFLGWIIWQKSQSDKSDKQKASYYNFSVLLEKSQTYLNKNSNPVTYDNDFT